MGYNNKYTILCIGDNHEPYSHVDSLDFVKEVNRIFNPNRIIHLGDFEDQQALNMHGRNPDLPSHKYETEDVTASVQKWAYQFPVMDICHSNHSRLPNRNAFKAGISDKWIRSPEEVFGAPVGWKRSNKIEFNFISIPDNPMKILFQHKLGKNGIGIAQKFGCCLVQGHHHSKLGVNWFNTPYGPRWSLDIGCLIDDDTLAFEYNKEQKEIPILGCGVIIGGVPIPIPMLLDSQKRWIGKIIIGE